MVLNILLGLLLIFGIGYTIILLKDFFKAKAEGRLEKETSFWKMGAVGFIAIFLDVLGIGSFATITAFSKTFRLTKDKTLPGTLLVSVTIPAFFFSYLFVSSIEVDTATLIVMTITSVLGAYFGAGIVAKLNEKLIQLTMGIALGIVGIFILLGQLSLVPVGGAATGLHGISLIIGGIVGFILGALMTVGVGYFAPCMAFVYAMGMSPAAAFPLMVTACAFLQPTGAYKFIKEDAYDRKAALAITIFGFIGGLIAFYVVKSIPLYALKWVVFAVVIYTATNMFLSYKKAK